VGELKRFDASGVAGKVLMGPWAETRDKGIAARASKVERVTGGIVKDDNCRVE